VNVPLWAAELATTFWSLVGYEESFPRNLSKAIKRGLPITLVPMPRLTVESAHEWLQQNGSVHRLGGPNRRLPGCLLALNGHGIVLIDSCDSEDEQRFTLAHELAHFLRDYWRPRQLVIDRLGQQALEVIDGKRPPTPEERLCAVFRGVPLGLQVHLMDRSDKLRPVSFRSNRAEECADRLACQLLAPAEHVAASYKQDGCGRAARSLADHLANFYGLPVSRSKAYARSLLGDTLHVEPWLGSLRESLSK
jgi:hypothetical protein